MHADLEAQMRAPVRGDTEIDLVRVRPGDGAWASVRSGFAQS